jgi:hypothetical protein
MSNASEQKTYPASVTSISAPLVAAPWDERQTLAILAWTIGGVVGLFFILNALSLATM